MTRLPSSIAAAFLAALLACDVVGLGGPGRRTLLLQHYRAECQGEALSLCLLVKEPGDSDFGFFYGSIEGFVYEWGYLYTLEVDEHRIEDPPADGSSIRTVLRTVIARERVPPGTQFDLVLTPGDGRVVEIARDHWRFHWSAEFTCPADASCAELREQLAAGGRVEFRFEHPVAPGDPITLVRWAPCDPAHSNRVFSCRD